MRIRFHAKVAVRGGAQYNPGEEADLPAAVAEPFLSGGFAQRVLAADPPTPPPEKPPARGLEHPPADKMLRKGDTQRKGGG